MDDNGYLKKAELEEAAKAWNDDLVEEAVAEETSEDSADDVKVVLFVQQSVLMMLTPV